MSEDGQSSHIQDKLLSIDVQPGWKEGTTITFPKEGDQARGTVPADVVFVVKEKPHPRFTRQQDELTHTAHVCLEKALLGCAVEVETLDGRLLNIGIHELIDHKYTKVVPGEGMPLMRNPRLKGDLVIRFEIKSPKTLAADKKQLLKRALRA
ncbi:DJB13 protein, partial [Amia calva]|nr:DJB13 protein [Amia calva]